MEQQHAAGAGHDANSSNSAAPPGEADRGQADEHSEGQSGAQPATADTPKKGQSQKKPSSFKYCKDEKLAILQVLLKIGSELWNMEKAINKPWRMLYWEHRVANPISELLRNNYRYVDEGFDIDQRFGSAAGIENLRRWVRSQRTQETERVEAERIRPPGSPAGRPLSEVQKLRARVFADIIQAEKNGEIPPTTSNASASAVEGAMPTDAGAGHNRESSLEPLSMFSPTSSNGRMETTATAYGSFVETGGVPLAGGAAAAAAAAAAHAAAAGTASPGSAIDVESSSESARHQLYVTNNGKGPVLAPRPAAVEAHRTMTDQRIGGVNVDSSGGFGSPGVSPPMGAMVLGVTDSRPAVAAGAAVLAGTGTVRRPISESTPDDFRRAETLSKKKRQKVDHSEVVSKVMAQVNNLNLPVEALELLAESLHVEISEARGTGGVPYTGPGVAGGRALGCGLSLQERQLLLEEKVQASRDAEASQLLAERRLKLMEEMRATGNHVVTDDVLQKQRLVVLGLAPPLQARRGGLDGLGP